MAIGDPSHEDAATDAVSVIRVDDHGVALDAAIRVDVADVEKAALGDGRAQVHDGLGVAVGVARPEGEVRSIGDPRVVVDRAPWCAIGWLYRA